MIAMRISQVVVDLRINYDDLGPQAKQFECKV